jgi:hypothetical protein
LTTSRRQVTHRRRHHLRPGRHVDDLRLRRNLRHLNPAVTDSSWRAGCPPGGCAVHRPHRLPAHRRQPRAARDVQRPRGPRRTIPPGARDSPSGWKRSSPAFSCSSFSGFHQLEELGVMAGIAIGGVIGLEAMFAGPICGASMNPARSLAR